MASDGRNFAAPPLARPQRTRAAPEPGTPGTIWPLFDHHLTTRLLFYAPLVNRNGRKQNKQTSSQVTPPLPWPQKIRALLDHNLTII
jgi:hypothetical protein